MFESFDKQKCLKIKPMHVVCLCIIRTYKLIDLIYLQLYLKEIENIWPRFPLIQYYIYILS
jgi:hypothetical protein